MSSYITLLAMFEDVEPASQGVDKLQQLKSVMMTI